MSCRKNEQRREREEKNERKATVLLIKFGYDYNKT
jgi:hypothetical protein